MHDLPESIALNSLGGGIPRQRGWPVERITSMMAGAVVLVTLILGRTHTSRWRLLTSWVGANLLFNGVAGWCPMGLLLHRLGVSSAAESGACPT